MATGLFYWLILLNQATVSEQLNQAGADETRHLKDENPATGDPVAGFFMLPELARFTS